MKKHFKNRSGFTLIELLVVISIISLLSSISMSVLSDARIRAADTKLLQELRQVEIALHLYYNKHGVFPRTRLYSGGSTDTLIYCAPGQTCINGPFTGKAHVDGKVNLFYLIELLASEGFVSVDILKNNHFFHAKNNFYTTNAGHRCTYKAIDGNAQNKFDGGYLTHAFFVNKEYYMIKVRKPVGSKLHKSTNLFTREQYPYYDLINNSNWVDKDGICVSNYYDMVNQ
jgi:prepilin-type N-terminal cleavage/methylation domain-containing protein